VVPHTALLTLVHEEPGLQQPAVELDVVAIDGRSREVIENCLICPVHCLTHVPWSVDLYSPM
jgi:hypothetical protein